MKIVSFNINGLNAFDSKGNLEKIINSTNADIYCFQEIKISEKKVDKMNNIFSKFPNYIAYNNICTSKQGYAGVSILVNTNIKDRVLNVTYPNILDNKLFESYKHQGNGRVITIEFDTFCLVNAYVVNSGNKQAERHAFDLMMIDYINSLNKPCIYCGDMNVCATQLDYWGNYEYAKNSSPGLYEFEINDFALLLNNCKLIDTYRYKNGNKKEYSWYSPISNKTNPAYKLRHGWRIDYFLVSDSIKDNVEYSKIYEGWNQIDHSPIEMEIQL